MRDSRRGLCCAHERKWAGIIARERNETGCRTGSRAAFGASRALLPELFGGIEREPVQVELFHVRVLFELLRFLLSMKILALESPDAAGNLHLQCLGTKLSGHNSSGDKEMEWNARQAQYGRAH